VPAYPPEVRYGGDIVVAASVDRFKVAVGVRNWQETD
jgi:hypothetical protein